VLSPSTLKALPARKKDRHDTGVDVAIPNSNRVPLMNEPHDEATKMRIVSDLDTLVLIDRKPHSGWYDVIDVHTGKEGWVRQSDVLINLTKHPATESKFSEQYVGSDAAPKITVFNQTGRDLSLKIGANYFTLQPNSQLLVPIADGTFSFYGTEPDVIPASGTQEFKRGYEYTWKFWIQTTAVRLP
jgi:hypothetical protein